MVKLSTFEDIFNRLFSEYKNHKVKVLMLQNKIILGTFQAAVDNILIEPVSDEKLKQNTPEDKLGVILIEETNNNSQISIPFILGFNTMEAYFLKDRASIKSMGLKFILKKLSNYEKDRKQLA